VSVQCLSPGHDVGRQDFYMYQMTLRHFLPAAGLLYSPSLQPMIKICTVPGLGTSVLPRKKTPPSDISKPTSPRTVSLPSPCGDVRFPVSYCGVVDEPAT